MRFSQLKCSRGRLLFLAEANPLISPEQIARFADANGLSKEIGDKRPSTMKGNPPGCLTVKEG